MTVPHLLTYHEGSMVPIMMWQEHFFVIQLHSTHIIGALVSMLSWLAFKFRCLTISWKNAKSGCKKEDWKQRSIGILDVLTSWNTTAKEIWALMNPNLSSYVNWHQSITPIETWIKQTLSCCQWVEDVAMINDHNHVQRAPHHDPSRRKSPCLPD